MSQRPPCPYCGNSTFEEENGILVCTSCGRQQEGGLQVADDDADFGTQGKVTRKKVEKRKVKASKVYRGARGYRLYLLAWQHIVWRQCHALIHGAARMPEELWNVVRDLWTLKLERLRHRLDGHASRSTDAETDHATEDPTSDSGGEDASSSERSANLQPKLWDTISLIYLGSILLRNAISLSKLYKSIRNEDLPFIRGIRHVPTDITSRLPSEYQLALDTITIPTQQELHNAAYKLLQDYVQNFGITVPALNWKLLLFEWIQELGLPIEVYATVKKLAGLVGYEFMYELSARDKPQGGQTQRKRRSPVAMPEVQLVCLIVVATKLLYPFAKLNSFTVQEKGLPTGLHIDWEVWLKVHKAHYERKTSVLEPDQAIEISANDIHKLDPEALDQYMDWYQATFTTPETVLKAKKTDLETSILNTFPLSDPSPNASPELGKTPEDEKARIIELVSEIQRETVIPAPTASQPQHPNTHSENAHSAPPPRYLIFPNLDTLQATNIFFDNDASKNYIAHFHRLAAELACLDTKRLLIAVRHTEKRLEDWHNQRRRTEVLDSTEMRGR